MYTVQPSFKGIRIRPIKGRTYVFGFLGVFFLIIGLFTIVTQVIFERSSITVDIKITQIIHKTSREMNGYASVFEIIEGKYAGRRHSSRDFIDHPIYEIGDHTKGQFDPISGEIKSKKAITDAKLFSAIYTLFGALITCLSIASYYRQKHKPSWSRLDTISKKPPSFP